MPWITLTKDFHCRVSGRDFDSLSRFSWCADVRVLGVGAEQVYAVRYTRDTGKTRKFYMHREIVQPPEGYVVDHKDGNTLDNRRGNLRLATPGQNRFNGGHQGGLSEFKGVSPVGNRWRARLQRKNPDTGKHDLIYSEYFETEIEAAEAYDKAVLAHIGPFGRLNFPITNYEPTHPKEASAEDIPF